MTAAKRIILFLWLVLVGVTHAPAAVLHASENRTWEKIGAPSQTRLAEPAQVAGSHQEKTALGSKTAVGCCLAAKTEANIVYRALNAKDAERYAAGLGLEAKNPGGAWNLGEHIAQGSSKASWVNDPWIATSSDINIARAFDTSGNGILAIDLNKVTSLQQRAWEMYPRVNGVQGLPYHYSIWQQETSVFQNIPREAISGFVK